MSFGFFGCWNRDVCEDEVNPRDIVLNVLKQNISELDIDRVIVAGDNIYQFETEEGKMYRKHTIRSGFKKVNELGIPVDMILGNHDAEYDCILDYEKEQVKRFPNIHLYTENHTERFENVNIIYLDTNSVDLEVSEETTKYRELDRILDYLRTHMTSDVVNVVVGHQPIFSHKGKNPTLSKTTNILLKR